MASWQMLGLGTSGRGAPTPAGGARKEDGSDWKRRSAFHRHLRVRLGVGLCWLEGHAVGTGREPGPPQPLEIASGR